jgi:PKD repeat protein
MIDGNAHDITIKNNIFEVGWGVNCSNSHNIFIYNNTFIGDLSITSGYPGAFIADDGTVSNIEIKNNISVDYKGNGNHRNLTGCTGLVVDYNCLYNTDGSYPNAVFPGPQSHELWGKDPKFVNPSNRDFHLQSTSPCVNTGAVMPDNTWDYELNPRPVGSGWDIGGYEFNPGGPKEPENPVAQFFANPSQGFLPLQVNFDASASYDPDGSISKYEWDFGDDSTGSDKISNHTFVKRGNFNVALKVTDNTMRSDVAVKEIITYSKATALFTASLLTLKAPQVISFDGSASYDRYGTIVAYKWTFGDGASGNGKALIHRFPKKGSYIVTLKVINDQGYIGEISKSIEVSSSNLRERRR